MPKYIVKEGNTVEHDQRVYVAGKEIELTDEQAEKMPHAVEPAPARFFSKRPDKSDAGDASSK